MDNSILIYCPDYKPSCGGTAEFAYQVSLTLSQKGWKVVVLACNAEEDNFDSKQPFKTVRKLPVFHGNGICEKIKFGFKLFAFPAYLKHMIFKYNFKYVLFTDLMNFKYTSGFFRGLAAKRVKVAKGIILHGSDVVTFPKAQWITKWIIRGIIQRMENLFCNSKFTASLASNTFELPYTPTVVGCGINPETMPQSVDKIIARRNLKIDSQYVLLTVGRLIPRKGIDMVMKALPEILFHFPSLTYIIAGDGPDRGRLMKLASHTGCMDHIRFDGEFKEELLSHYYCSADLYVMPSRYIPKECVEGFGIVFIEAGYYGLPVIGGLSGGVPDAIVDGKTGVLVDPESIDDLTHSIIYLLKEPHIRYKMGNSGKQRALNELSWDLVTERIHTEIKMSSN
jgi:glycosyltransferase involved in cell wall biosynthesis